MARLTTRQALKLLLTDEYYLLAWLKAGYTKAARSRLKYRLEHEQLSVEKMEEVLSRCGFSAVQEKIWRKP